jgi:hypothetical protein
MTEEECIETFQALSTIVEEQGLGWVVEAVEREIQEGVLEEASEKDLTAEGMEPPSIGLAPAYRRSIKKAAFLVRREFSQRDRVLLLVDALEEVISDAHDIEKDMLHFFGESGGPAKFQFVDLQYPFSRLEESREEMGGRSASVEKLQGLLQALRQEIPE